VRKVLTLAANPLARMTWDQCRGLAAADPDCGDTAYGAAAGNGVCRCVLEGRQCTLRPSSTGNAVYKRVCNDPNPPVPPPCSEIETVSQELVDARKEIADMRAKIADLESQLVVKTIEADVWGPSS
jgi:hypothetical protein